MFFPVSVLAAALTVVTGCETKGLIDPTATGRWKSAPLAVRVLDRLDTGIEEPENEFMGAGDVRQEDLVAPANDYAIGKNDLLSISISDLVGPGVETVKTVRVSESGNVSLPLLKDPIHAQGLTEAELEKVVVERYKDQQLIQNAQVSVTVVEARARTFSVSGAVNQIGEYAIVKANFRVLDALVLARGTQVADQEYIYVIRHLDNKGATTKPATTQPGPDIFEPAKTPKRSAETPAANTPVATKPATQGAGTSDNERIVDMPGGKSVVVGKSGAEPTMTEGNEMATTGPATSSFEFSELTPVENTRVIRIPLQPLQNGDLRYNIVILPNDMIVAPQPIIGEYYMAGHVVRVGVYSLSNRKITLKQAIVSAGMFDGIAIPDRTEIIRRVGPNKEVFARVNLDKIWAGQQPDLYLKPNDVVNVGTNAVAPFLAALRGAFRFTYGFGFLYDKNFANQNRLGL
jgi:protein involved in polysaccharide export with SLBB domain